MKLLSTKEAAEKLGVSIRRIQAMIKDNKLPATKIGRDYVIEETALESVKTYGKAGRPPQTQNSDDQS